MAQEHSQPADKPDTQSSQAQSNGHAKSVSPAVTIPAGTRLALVLTHPIQSRYIHRGDDIYAQITSPVNSATEVVIPPGTFVDGKVDKLERKGGRAELRLQSMAISFPDGYVAPISGPVTLESDDGYALKDPGHGRLVGAFVTPLAGVGLGALIGHAAASSQPQTITSTLPPGCTGPPPGCLMSSVTGPASAGKSTAIGAGIGGAIGAVVSITLLLGSHNFYLDVGSPVEMTLQQPIKLEQNEVDAAVQQSAQHPVAEQPIAPRPAPPWMPDSSPSAFPGPTSTPGPPIIIPGPPGPDGVPGPPIVIPQGV
jgi:hypothetical protein